MNVSTTNFDVSTGGVYVSTAVITISDKSLASVTNYTPPPESMVKAELREKRRLLSNQAYLQLRNRRGR